MHTSVSQTQIRRGRMDLHTDTHTHIYTVPPNNDPFCPRHAAHWSPIIQPNPKKSALFHDAWMLTVISGRVSASHCASVPSVRPLFFKALSQVSSNHVIKNERPLPSSFLQWKKKWRGTKSSFVQKRSGKEGGKKRVSVRLWWHSLTWSTQRRTRGPQPCWHRLRLMELVTAGRCRDTDGGAAEDPPPGLALTWVSVLTSVCACVRLGACVCACR